MMRIATSKILLTLVIVGGLIGVYFDLFRQFNNVIIYVAILAGAAFNRLDSRKKGYEFSAGFGGGTLNVKTGGDDYGD